MSFSFGLGVASVFSGAVPLLAGFSLFRRLRPDLSFFAFLFLFAFFVDLATLHYYGTKNLHWMHHAYTPIEYVFIVGTFSLWQANQRFRRILRLSIPVYLLIGVVDIFWTGDLSQLNGTTQSIANTVYVIISGITLFNLQKSDIGSIHKECSFWISSGLLVYASGSLIHFAFHSLYTSMWLVGVHALLNISANIAYAVGFICQARRSD